VALGFPALATAGQVLYSTSFENGLETWQNGPATVQTQVVHTGTSAVRLDAAWFYRDRTLPTTVPTLVKVSYWCRGPRFSNGNLYVGLASADWVQHTYFSAYPSHPIWLGIGTGTESEPLFLDDVTVESASPLDFLRHIHGLFNTWGASISLNSSSRTQERLPKTFESLRTGRPLKLVMLGDSIVNDTFSSAWMELLPLHYPQAQITVHPSVRGSTGMDWYAADTDENGQPVDRLEEYVITHRPDLVLLGGISHKDNSEAYRTVIRKLRAKSPGLEILVSTGMSGSVDPRALQSWQFDVNPAGTGFRSRLCRLAEEEQVGFLDAQASWEKYIRDITLPYSTFKRDSVHMNQNGGYLAAEIMRNYFAEPCRTNLSLTVLEPAYAEDSFRFKLPTQANHTYTVESTTSFKSNSWTFSMSLIGDGSVKSVAIPRSGEQESYFRVRQP